MHARARDFAGCKQARNRRSSVEVGLHAAHDVVRGRTDWNAIAREIEAGSPAHFRDQRKSFVDKFRV